MNIFGNKTSDEAMDLAAKLVERNPNGTLRSTSVHYDAVKAFTLAMGQPVGEEISDYVSNPLTKLRINLISEELKEVCGETVWRNMLQKKVDKAALTKELADLLYVTYGFAVTFGLPIDEVFERVHRSNMSKLGDDGKPVYREDRKVLKGPNYQPPDLTDLFE